jgi:hypothetical protein
VVAVVISVASVGAVAAAIEWSLYKFFYVCERRLGFIIIIMGSGLGWILCSVRAVDWGRLYVSGFVYGSNLINFARITLSCYIRRHFVVE